MALSTYYYSFKENFKVFARLFKMEAFGFTRVTHLVENKPDIAAPLEPLARKNMTEGDVNRRKLKQKAKKK